MRTGLAADAAPAPAPAAATLPVGALPPRGARGPWVLAVLLGALAAAGLTAYVGLERSNEALVHRLQQLESEGAAAAERGEQALRAARAETQKLADDLDRLRQQRADLDQLYLDLTRGRDEAALWEVERLVTVAAQELQVGGNLGTALAALQAADARLARIDRPQLVNLRRALTGDIERLRSAPAVDLTGLAVKLDQLAAAVDGWPLLAEPPRKGPLAPAAPAAPGAAEAAARGRDSAEAGAWAGVRRWLREEFGGLLQIRQVDTPEALLLDATQQRLARQQMRLRLLNARQALLQRNDKLYRGDLGEAQQLLGRYFDVRQPAVAAAAAQLKSMAQAPLSVDVPRVDATLAALRAARGGR
ncbi:MAG: uroporphyrinogen-III C-methyltransferase [Burkholderiales bacterium]|nr:uroporphyrinogen-III C-methyltransferase [Burkholderiales bacterium]